MRRGARLVVVDPRRVGLAARADEWLRVRPGTDAALALSLAAAVPIPAAAQTGAQAVNTIVDFDYQPLTMNVDVGTTIWLMPRWPPSSDVRASRQSQSPCTPFVM